MELDLTLFHALRQEIESRGVIVRLTPDEFYTYGDETELWNGCCFDDGEILINPYRITKDYRIRYHHKANLATVEAPVYYVPTDESDAVLYGMVNTLLHEWFHVNQFVAHFHLFQTLDEFEYHAYAYAEDCAEQLMTYWHEHQAFDSYICQTLLD